MNAICRSIACAGLLGLAGTLHGQGLGPPPRFDAPQFADPDQWESVSRRPLDRYTVSMGSVSLSPLDRYAVSMGYRLLFVPLASVAHGWTGNADSCSAGTTTNAYQQAAIDRVNFYRALAGLPGDVALSADDAGTQEAALMMNVNNAINHAPPTYWACYTPAGAAAALRSNIALGVGGTDAVDLYVDDPLYFVGHRRWILYPPQRQMASGSIPIPSSFGPPSNVLTVIDWGTRPPTPNGVAWPPHGFVPYQMLPALSNLWSLSYPGADFSAATVTMATDGSSIAVTLEAFQNNAGYGDNTIVWRPFVGSPGVSYAPPTSADRRYTVNIANVSGSGVPTSFAYDVIVIDPADAVFKDGFE